MVYSDYNAPMDEIDKQTRRSALKLVIISLSLGFLIGLGVGIAVAYRTIDRVVIVNIDEGIEV